MRSVYIEVADSGDRSDFGLDGFSKLFPLFCFLFFGYFFLFFFLLHFGEKGKGWK